MNFIVIIIKLTARGFSMSEAAVQKESLRFQHKREKYPTRDAGCELYITVIGHRDGIRHCTRVRGESEKSLGRPTDLYRSQSPLRQRDTVRMQESAHTAEGGKFCLQYASIMLDYHRRSTRCARQ